jgi:hypothetical protein
MSTPLTMEGLNEALATIISESAASVESYERGMSGSAAAADRKVSEAAQSIRDAFAAALQRAEAAEHARDVFDAELTDVAGAIGSPEFMDPPDGGGVSLGEQVERMRARLSALDADRERLEGELRALRETKGSAGQRVESVAPTVRPTGSRPFNESFDARDWATAFVEHVRANPDIATDEGTMISWFANAIMRGYDEAQNRAARASHGGQG